MPTGVYPRKPRPRKISQPNTFCAQCSEPFFAPTYELKHANKRFCSKQCFNDARRKPLQEGTCPTCGVSFFRRQREFRRGKIYCSVACIQHTSPQQKQYPTETIEECFWRQVDQTICLGEGCGCQKGIGHCWPWIGTRHHNYGILAYNGSSIGAHRFACILEYGPIPPEIRACHHCDNPPCCRGTHLFSGTDAMNIQDAAKKGRLTPREARQAMMREKAKRGENHYRAKLTDADIPIIRELALQISQHAIAKQFHVSQPNIRAIVNHWTWTHIP